MRDLHKSFFAPIFFSAYFELLRVLFIQKILENEILIYKLFGRHFE